MSKTLSEVPKEIAVASIVHHGEKLILPEGLSIDGAIDLLYRRQQYEQEEINLSEKFDVFPWDGAHALDVILTRRYGWSPAEATPGFFGKNPPKMVAIDVGPGQVKHVPWGRFSLPGIDGFIQTFGDTKEGRAVFGLGASIKRKDQEQIKSLFAELREELIKNSIYRGKAIKLRFLDDDGDMLEMPEPKFLDTSSVNEGMLVYSADVMDCIETNLFTPIERVRDCLANGIPVKRGVLLGGTFGTGKTLAAHIASKKAVENGITYLYIPRADELSHAIEFAKQYQSPACVIFCEDIDRAVSGERSVEMDDILNIIDGIDTKSANIIVVMTTNALDSINPAMLRPGRLDAVIEVTPPDGPAVEKLLRIYAGNTIAPETDLSKASGILAGNIPAVIAEVVKRAKLAQLKITPTGEKLGLISEKAMVEAAATMKRQMQILHDATVPKEAVPTLDDLMQHTVRSALNGTKEAIANIEQGVDGLVDRILS